MASANSRQNESRPPPSLLKKGENSIGQEILESLKNRAESELIDTASFTNIGLGSIVKRQCEHMNLVFNLCCQLEHIADQLPDKVDKQDCLYIARSIHSVVKHAHDFEEKVLFPLLREKIQDNDLLEQTLQRLHGEHLEDESYAEEVHNGLISFVSGLSEANFDSLGYMLRGFFEGMRRHLAFEREHVLPLLIRIDGNSQPTPL